MFLTAIIAIAVAGVLGLLVMTGFRMFGGENYYGETHEIRWAEYGVVMIAMAAIFTPSVLAIGNALSVAQLLSYEQFVNGVETAATDSVKTCYAGHRGNSEAAGHSNCSQTYISGYYDWTWTETVQDCTTDSKGNQTCTLRTVVHYERSAIYTPYATREHTYRIDWSMGGAGNGAYTFPYAYLDEQPVRHPESDRDIPADILRGAPADWTEAMTRLNAGDPRAVTQISSYDNYILASGDEVLKTYGARLEEYLAAGLLPDHTANIKADPITGVSRSQADKVSFVGVSVSDTGVWQRAVMRFNAALGMKLQGDLHVVLVDAATVPSSDSVPYTQALKAYWQGETFGKRALAKNGIILVLGVNTTAGTIDWADASTGMPFGNELMIQYLRDELTGKVLEPSLLFGTPRTIIGAENTATITLTTPRGVVEEIVFEQAPFKRARMSCADDTCVGYKDLVSKIEPTNEQKTWMVVVTSLIALGLWIAVALTSFVSSAIESVLDWAHSRSRGGAPTEDADPYQAEIDQMLARYSPYTRDHRGHEYPHRKERKY